MKKIFIFLLLLVFITASSSAQRARYGRKDWQREKHKFYCALGASEFYGDLGGLNKIGSEAFSLRDFDIQAVRPAFQFGYLYRFSKFFAWRSSFDYIWLSGNDKWTKETFRSNRNLNFRTPTYGLTTSIVFLYQIQIKQKGHQFYLKGIQGWGNYIITPYVQIGIGGFYFNSKGNYHDSWKKLKPLCTEGQGLVTTRKKYSSIQPNIPLGVGIRFWINKQWEVGLEYSQWITFTDYIDDVSTTYFDKDALIQSKGQIAADMANPSPTALISDPSNPGYSPLYRSTLPGQQRGDPRDNDHYINLMFTVYYTITKGFTPKRRY